MMGYCLPPHLLSLHDDPLPPCSLHVLAPIPPPSPLLLSHSLSMDVWIRLFLFAEHGRCTPDQIVWATNICKIIFHYFKSVQWCMPTKQPCPTNCSPSSLLLKVVCFCLGRTIIVHSMNALFLAILTSIPQTAAATIQPNPTWRTTICRSQPSTAHSTPSPYLLSSHTPFLCYHTSTPTRFSSLSLLHLPSSITIHAQLPACPLHPPHLELTTQDGRSRP